MLCRTSWHTCLHSLHTHIHSSHGQMHPHTCTRTHPDTYALTHSTLSHTPTPTPKHLPVDLVTSPIFHPLVAGAAGGGGAAFVGGFVSASRPGTCWTGSTYICMYIYTYIIYIIRYIYILACIGAEQRRGCKGLFKNP